MVARDRLSMEFAALADPTRRDILTRLRGRSLTVSELAESYPISRAAVSQHLTVLEKAGLVTRGRRGQWIDCSLSSSYLDEVAAWVEQQRSDWAERFDLLDEHLRNRRERGRETDNEAEGEQQ
ncbi:metalloregulator ArsR/SmtB family transcription factor [Nocardiopsis sp. YSL2]|uniref:metalloregulator ArsR/SmtB family transcription factor n=1 Tax=Nocardiopsis sp. YSL2 TaxID=2939492 RepID=UPI0026F446CA|nr:metalloregulator ArsR/SmtB family transcription factor [Nocardiopsis sp. YSL2]